MTRYYRRAVTIVDAEELGGVMTEKLAELFEENAAPASRGAPAPQGRRLRLIPAQVPDRRRCGRRDARPARALPGAAPAGLRGATAIDVEARPIARLSTADPDRSRFGALMFRSGIDLRSTVSAFGGFSGLWRSANGAEIVALADNAQVLKARVETSDGRLSGLSGSVLSPLILANGVPMRRSRYYDTESFALAGNAAYRRRRAQPCGDAVRCARPPAASCAARRFPIPHEVRDLPSNGGLEALGIAPQRSLLGGALVGIAEGATGFILTGPRQGAFQVAARRL